MEKKIAIGLIKLEALNNIDAQDSEALQYLKRNDDDFPWKEFGDYQNLVAILAVTSKIENPDTQLKQRIFTRLYNFKPKSESDEIFEPAVIENNFQQNDEPVKFKLGSETADNNLHNGPDIEIEEYDPDSNNKTENTIETSAKAPLIFKINQDAKTDNDNKSSSEQLYEIEEYDLEMAHQDHLDTINEANNEEQPIEELSSVNQDCYEIEEYDLEETGNNISDNQETAVVQDSTEPADVEQELIIDQAQEPEQPEFELEVEHVIEQDQSEPELVIEHVNEPDQSESELVIEHVSEPDQPEQVMSENKIETVDDIVIYNESEAIEELKSEIIENVIEAIPEKIKEEVKQVKNKNNPEAQNIPLPEKINDAKSKSLSSDSISFKEPNLSQLHSLFKDTQEVHANEKSARAEYRSKVNKEQAVSTPKPEEIKPAKVENVIESPVTPEVKPEEKEVVHQEEISAAKQVISDEKDQADEKIKSPVKLKKEKEKAGSKKIIVIAATILIVCAAVLFFMQSSDDVKGEQVNKVEQTTNQQVNTDTYTEVVEEKKPEGTIIVEDIKPVKQNNTALLKPETKLPAPPKQPTLIEPEIVPEVKKENSTSQVTEKTETKTETPPVIKEEKKVEEEPAYFVAVEEMPSPIGGLAGIQSRIVYPNLAKTAGVEGKVLVLAYVNESGNVTKVELVKGIGAGCDEVALDAVRQTKFKPGLQRGKPVKVKITIPIVFKKS